MKENLEQRVTYVRDAPTRAEARRYALGFGAEVRFPKANAPFHRKSIIVHNLDPANPLHIRYATSSTRAEPQQAELTGTDKGAIGDRVLALQTKRYDTSDDVWINNPATSGTIYLDVTEYFYI